MPYNSKTIGETPLDDFVEVIPTIYKIPDQKRSIWDCWLHANHHASAIGEEIRKNKPGSDLLKEIAVFSMWLFTFLGKTQGEMCTKKDGEVRDEESLIRVGYQYSELLWNKYPSVCPMCFWRRTNDDSQSEDDASFGAPCDCLIHEVESRDQSQKRSHVEKLRAFARKTVDKKPSTVDEWQRMFQSIYQANLRHLTLNDIAFHLLEEMGEVSDAMVRMYTFREEELVKGEPNWRQVWLEEELADVSSWLFALVIKLDFMREIADAYDEHMLKQRDVITRLALTLSRIVWTYYGSDDIQGFFCEKCTEKVCVCPIKLVPNDLTLQDIVSLKSEAF